MKKYFSEKLAKYNFTNNIIQPWNEEAFLYKLKKINARISPERNYILKQYAEAGLKVEGIFAEFGVYKGSSALLIAETIKDFDRELHLFDTFSGSPSESSYDKDRKVFYNDVDFEKVKTRFSQYEFVNFHKGYLPQTFKLPKDRKISFAHFHLNLYQSTADTLFAISDNLHDKSIILIEDYGIKQCSGVKDAVDKFVRESNKNLVYLPTCQAVIW